MKRSNNFLIIISLLTMYIVWGSTYLAIGIAVKTWSPFIMIGTRFIAAGFILFLIALMRREKLPTRRQWAHSAFIGLLMLGGGVGVVAYVEQFVATGLVAVMIAAVPIWAALFSGFFGKWPSQLEWAGIIVGIMGVVLLNFEGDLRGNPLSALALLGAAGSWAFGSVLSKSRFIDMPKGASGVSAEMLSGGLLLTLFSLFILREPLPLAVSGASFNAWLYLVIPGSVITFSAYMYLVNNVSITIATSYAYVNPVIAVFLGVGLGREHISTLGYTAMLIILFGVSLIGYAQYKSNKANHQ